MRYSIILPAFAAAAAFAQSFTQTNSLGVVTGQPSPVTTQPAPVTTRPTAATSQPAAVTSQSPAAIVPAGQNSTFVTPVVIATGSSSRPLSGVNSTAVVGTAGTGSLRSTQTTATGTGSRTTSGSSTSGSSSRASSGSSTATGSGATTTSSRPASSADMIQPVLGLGLAGAIFAAFL